MTPKFNRKTILFFLPLLFVALSGCGDDASQSLSGTPVDLVAPATPANLMIENLGETLNVSWDENSEPDLAGYVLQRSVDGGTSWATMTGGIMTAASFSDEYRASVDYRVAAMDQSSNQSAFSRRNFGADPGPRDDKIPTRDQ